MPYVIRAAGSVDGQITLDVSDATLPVAIVDLHKLHGIWRQQDVYSRIKTENDEYENGTRKGTILYELPIISVNIDSLPPILNIPILPRRSTIEIGFTNGMHRLDYFFRLGARILPVHTTTEASKISVQHHVGASDDLIAQELISDPNMSV